MKADKTHLSEEEMDIDIESELERKELENELDNIEEDDFEDIDKIHIFDHIMMDIAPIIYSNRQDQLEYSNIQETHEQIAHEALSFAKTIVNLRNSYIKEL